MLHDLATYLFDPAYHYLKMRANYERVMQF